MSNQNGFPTFHTGGLEVGKGNSPDGTKGFTDFTDFTPLPSVVYVAGPPARSRARPRAYSSTPSADGVKSVNRVKPQHVEGWCPPPHRETGCEFHAAVFVEVVA